MAFSPGNLPSSFQVSAKGTRLLRIQETARAFGQKAADIEDAAAERATEASQGRFRAQLSGRPLAPPRRGGRYGRPTTEGTFADRLLWEPDGDGNVEFDIRKIRSAAPYFIIQEIGTAATANCLNPAGTFVVRSQIGRRISSNLFWASGPGGQALNAARGVGNDQLYYARDLDQNSIGQVRKRRKRIRREIKGKHYLQYGGIEGFRVLAKGLNEEARRIFK